MVTELAPGLFSIKIRLPDSPLKNLNSYVFLGGERNLLVDTGFDREQSLEDMRAGIAALRLDMAKTDIFCTHCHADHTGLAVRILAPGSRVFMSAEDKAFLEMRWNEGEKFERYTAERFLGNGFPPDEFREAFWNGAMPTITVIKRFPITAAPSGGVISAGSRRLRIIPAPGHTGGHVCLYCAEEKIMALGDHVLFDITPNITAWYTLPDSLAAYLESLRRIRAYETRLALPAHRGCSAPLAGRVDGLLAHHNARLTEAVNIVTDSPGAPAYEIASRLTWSIRAQSWADFPLTQKWFAFGETLSHLDYLVNRGALRREEQNGIARFFPLRPPATFV